MGRATAGVRAIKLLGDDQVLHAMVVVGNEGYVFVVTEQGYGKKTPVSDYPTKGRGTQGVGNFASGDHGRGSLVGALVVHDGDEVLLVRTSGKVVRSSADEVEARGRLTMGVQFAEISKQDPVLSIALNQEKEIDDEAESSSEGTTPDADGGSVDAAGDTEPAETDEDNA